MRNLQRSKTCNTLCNPKGNFEMFVCIIVCLPDTTWELIVVMATLPCCRPLAGTTIPEGLTELETEVMDGEEVWISSWGSQRDTGEQKQGGSLWLQNPSSKLHLVTNVTAIAAQSGTLKRVPRAQTYLLHVEAGVCRRVGSSQVIAEEVVAVHLGLEAGDVTVTEIFAELIDLL